MSDDVRTATMVVSTQLAVSHIATHWSVDTSDIPYKGLPKGAE